MNRSARFLVASLNVRLAAYCGPPSSGGELCVYAARSSGQFADELALFSAEHPEIALRCPDADPKALYCPSRITGAKASRSDQDSEDRVMRSRSRARWCSSSSRRGADTEADLLLGHGISHILHFSEWLASLDSCAARGWS